MTTSTLFSFLFLQKLRNLLMQKKVGRKLLVFCCVFFPSRQIIHDNVYHCFFHFYMFYTSVLLSFAKFTFSSVISIFFQNDLFFTYSNNFFVVTNIVEVGLECIYTFLFLSISFAFLGYCIYDECQHLWLHYLIQF